MPKGYNEEKVKSKKPKVTSIQKKKLDSKKKRLFKARDKQRQAKKNEFKTKEQNKYVDKLKLLEQ